MTALEAGSLRQRCRQVGSSDRLRESLFQAPLLALSGVLVISGFSWLINASPRSLSSLYMVLSLCACLCAYRSLFCKDIGHVGLQPTLMDAANYIFSDPISKQGHVLLWYGTGGWGFHIVGDTICLYCSQTEKSYLRGIFVLSTSGYKTFFCPGTSDETEANTCSLF